MPTNPEKQFEYQVGTTERGGRERGLELYEAFLGFDKEILQGKKVLDVGTGETEKFSRELKTAGIDAFVVSLNPDLKEEEFRNKVSRSANWQKQSVAGIAQQLPFKDESFDYIFGLFSITVFSHPGENMAAAKLWAGEIARVLKPGGEIRIAPLHKIFYKDYEPLYRIWSGAGLKIHNLRNVRLHELGMTERSWSDKTGEHREPVDPKEESDICRLVLQKPLKTLNKPI